MSGYTALVGVTEPAARENCLGRLAGLPGIGGFELPIRPDGSLDDVDWVVANSEPTWSICLTLLPGTVHGLQQDADFGLASANASSRSAALRQVRQARAAAARLNERIGREVVTAVQLVSAPGQGTSKHSSAAAFLASLQEIVSWDWGAAAILVEHCDAYVPRQTPAKGFLHLAAEIEAVQAARREAGTNVGVSINWARSVIEQRTVEGASTHLRASIDAGVLRGLALSSCAASPTDYGPAWADAHLPLAPDPGLPAHHALEGSLLDRAEVGRTLELVSGSQLHLRCIKVASLRQASADVRVGLVAAYLRTVTETQAPALDR